MVISACAICESALRTEIDKKDLTWNADRTIQWARKRGVKISRTILARHRTDHNAKPANETEPGRISNEPPSKSAGKSPAEKILNTIEGPTDLLLLDTVRDEVFKKLKRGELDLKLDSAFKAIEIKHKIADESKNEKLLLEILAEIRADELRRKKTPQSIDVQ